MATLEAASAKGSVLKADVVERPPGFAAGMAADLKVPTDVTCIRGRTRVGQTVRGWLERRGPYLSGIESGCAVIGLTLYKSDRAVATTCGFRLAVAVRSLARASDNEAKQTSPYFTMRRRLFRPALMALAHAFLS